MSICIQMRDQKTSLKWTVSHVSWGTSHVVGCFSNVNHNFFHTEKLNNVTCDIDRLASDWLFFPYVNDNFNIQYEYNATSELDNLKSYFFFFSTKVSHVKCPLSHVNYNYNMQKENSVTCDHMASDMLCWHMNENVCI